MLRLKSIRKSYTTAGFTQNALDGVSIAFRDNEFAAILGPSGSGKTTMLNIIGGLDNYDSGDLEIDNIPTSNYKARDWDTYRNNRIGFVFQSYNLIPHQSVLANVELALTLSGVSLRERRKRAKQALGEVGLGDHLRKKPSQLSGGQMQRVAIARALINDPEILLADEPTGALDTSTSKQVMELLTKIAKNRLVIMVTHNNDLAEQYATRIVHLTDGRVKSDTRPFDPMAEDWRIGNQPRKASMSFLTAIMLSFSNLMTKKGRTITTAFAGSIGIIGIATIFAFSNGINEYIRTIEEETLSIYPLAIQAQGFDISGLFGANEDGESIRAGLRGGESEEQRTDVAIETQLMETLLSNRNTNDLASFKVYLEENEQTLSSYISTIHYKYDITPQIFLADTSNGIDQINPDSIFSGMMGAPGAPGLRGMDSFSEMPNDTNLFMPQYEVLAGRWPEHFNEAVLVLGNERRINDFMLFSLGVRDRNEMRTIFESMRSGTDSEIEISEGEGVYPFDTFLNMSYKVVHPAAFFQYDSLFDVWVDRSGDDDFMESLLNNSTDIIIVGIVQPNQDATVTMLSVGVNYTPELIAYLMEEAAQMPIVSQQLSHPELNILSGRTFADEQENPESEFDFSRIISVDEEIFRNALDFEDVLSGFDFSDMDFSDLDFSSLDMSGINLGNLDFGNMDLSGLDLSGLDFSNFDFSGLDFSNIDLGDLTFDLSGVQFPQLDIDVLLGEIAGQVSIPPGVLTGIMDTMLNDFVNVYVPSLPVPPLLPQDWIEALNNYLTLNSTTELIITALGQAIASTDLAEQIGAALQSDIEAAMMTYMKQVMDVIQLQVQAAMMNAIQGVMQSAMTGMMQSVSGQIETAMQGAMRGLSSQIGQAMQGTMSELSKQMESAMRGVTDQIADTIQSTFEDISEEMQSSMEGFDGEALADAFRIEISEDDIFELMTAIMNPSVTNYEQTLHKLGFADPGVPAQILIYPRSFEAKQSVLDILDSYNTHMEENDEPERVIHFTDMVGLMMSSVTDIIDMVSYALVAFVSVALVVSSIMIGVITFISVLERKKEIGILRAVGASKGNIRLVFNAETLIIGFVAGVIGVLATLLIVSIANIILNNLLGIAQLVIMPNGIAFALVAISMFLTFIAGLMPASAAARKAPVEALRSE